MARAKQTARKQGARVPIDKGTYGNIKKSASSSSSAADKALSSGKKKKAKKLQPSATPNVKKRSSISSNGSAGKKKKAAKKKMKPDNYWVLDYQKSQKKEKNGNKKKVPPRSARHHSTKKKRSSSIAATASFSQLQRDFRATPYNSNPPYMSSNKKSTKYPGRTRPLPKNINTPRKTRSGKLRLGLRKKLHCTSFTMSISECNDKVYLQKVDCPWYDSELDGQSKSCTAAHRDDKDDSSDSEDDSSTQNKIQPSRNAKSSKSTSSTNNSNTLTLPSESILSQIDTEIQQFTSYIKLNPSEYKARLSFIEHVTELSIEQFQGNGNYNNNSSIPRYQGVNYKGGRSASMINNNIDNNNNNTSRYNRKRTLSESLGDFANLQHQKEKEESSSIHVAPFGSFATQDVCTFASDVDMCLWGVVKGAASTSISKPQMFIGDNEDGARDEEGGNEDNEVIMDSSSGCPLLTESSLLRTMDAIQAAGHDITSPSSKKRKSKGGKKSSPSVAAGDSLFFIDRVGETQKDDEDGRDDVEVIDLCDDNTPKDEMDNQEKMSSSQSQPTKTSAKRDTEDANSKTAASDFQFVIDKKGVQELGGDAEESLPMEKSSRQEAGIDEADELKPPIDEADTRKMNKAKAKDDDDSEVIVVDSDSDDDADPMASYYNRQDGNGPANNDGRNEPSASGSVVLLDDDSSSDEEDDAVEDLTQDYSSSSDDEDEPSSTSQTPQKTNEVLELSVTSNKSALDRRESSSSIVRYADKPSFGPTGKARTHVVSALLSLTRQLKRSSHVHTIECRSKARVPIINCSTRTGFEGDIAIGGHNGVDTSMYALSQVKRFSSFAPIVLILKVIMAQQDLDKPFTGGLGSYKLYVLVAYHIDCHLASGGRDRPSEILISLLFRYGRMGKKRDKATTDLEQLKIREECVSTGGGMCELSPVFRLSDCVDLFQECHGRLSDRFLLVEDGCFDEKIAYLSSIIDCFRLIKARDTSKQRARLCDNLRRPIAHNDPGKVNPGRKIGTVFTKSGAVRDDTSSMKRSSRGNLVPKQRPDLDAKKSLRDDAAVIQRGMKNRKNNKKQKRDTALKEFASSHY